MAAVVWICAGILASASSDRADYEAAAARAGWDAGAQRKLAVWCEAHGLEAERRKHLAAALAIDPQDAAARGMMGLVAHDGDWLPPEKIGEAMKADEALTAKLAQYEARRQGTPDTADGQWHLALWCEQNGLKAEARAHLTAVTRIDPGRVDAWHRLGCESYQGRWLNAEQIAAERAEDRAQRDADRHWQPILERWKKELVDHSPRHELARAALSQIRDPRAVPSIRRVLAHGNTEEQDLAVELLGQIDCPASSRLLAGMTLDGRFPERRAAAIEILKRRDPRDFVDEMIGLMRRPLTYEVKPVGPHDEPGVLRVEGSQSRQDRIYRVPGVPGRLPPGNIHFNEDGERPTRSSGALNVGTHSLRSILRESPVELLREIASAQQAVGGPSSRARYAAESALSGDIRRIHSFNARVARTNQQVAAVLGRITGKWLPADPDAWLTWWNDQLGYRYQKYEPPPKPLTRKYVAVRIHASCFVAGTPVWTLTGPRPIESLRIGDLLLSQDAATGALSYEPIVDVHHNPPAEVLRIRLKDHALETTSYHRFWRPERGWVMARDLKAGDPLRGLAGRTEIVAVEPGTVQPVFNLDVARTCSYFVGPDKILVHDNSLPPAVLTPFDAPPSLAETAGEHAAPSTAPAGEIDAPGKGQVVPEPGSSPDADAAPRSPRRSSMLGPR